MGAHQPSPSETQLPAGKKRKQMIIKHSDMISTVIQVLWEPRRGKDSFCPDSCRRRRHQGWVLQDTFT